MPSSPSTRLRLELQAAGENLNTWGDTRLNAALQRLEEAISDWVAVTVTGNETLTSSNYVADEARGAMLSLNGTPGSAFDIVIPAVEKWYWVRNNTDAVATIKVSGQPGVAVQIGEIVGILCDGTDTYRLNISKVTSPLTVDTTLLVTGVVTFQSTGSFGGAVDMNGNKITELAAPSAGADAVNKTYADSLAFSSALPGQAGNSGLFLTTDGSVASWASQFPDQSGQGGNFLTTDGSTPSWDTVYPSQSGNAQKLLNTDGTNTTWTEWRASEATKTSGFTAVARLQPYYCDTSGGAFTITLPASPSDGDTVRIVSGDSASTSAITIARNGETIMGLAENMTIGVDNVFVTLVYRTNDWRVFQ